MSERSRGRSRVIINELDRTLDRLVDALQQLDVVYDQLVGLGADALEESA